MAVKGTLSGMLLGLIAGIGMCIGGMYFASVNPGKVKKSVKKAGKAANNALDGVEKFVLKHI